MTTADYRRHPARIEFKGDTSEVHIRASQVDGCGRMLYFSAAEEPISDDIPNETRARLAIGQALEPVVFKILEDEHGWQFYPKQLKVIELPLASENLVFTGIPDALGICERTGGKPTVVEVKTRSSHRFSEVKRKGNARAEFATMAQLSIYRTALVGMKAMDPETDAMVATLNRDSGELHLEWVSARNMIVAVSKAVTRINDVLNSWHASIPLQEFPPDSPQCRSCQWRTTCGNTMEGADGTMFPGVVDEEDAANSIRRWEPHRILEIESQMDERLDGEVRSRLLKFLKSNSLNRMQFHGEHYIWNVSLRGGNETYEYDPDMLRYFLTDEQMQQVIVEKKQKEFVQIRRGRRV